MTKKKNKKMPRRVRGLKWLTSELVYAIINRKYVTLTKRLRKTKFILIRIIEPYMFENANPEKARFALIFFLKRFKKCKPCYYPYFPDNSMFDSSYVFELLKIEQALRAENYALACHEMETYIYHKNFLDKGRYLNLVFTLERHLI